jgi:hypothetical protein
LKGVRVEAQTDYPARVATKLKIANHWRVAKRVAEAKVCESLASRVGVRLTVEEGGDGIAFKCPVPGCEGSEKEFRTGAALKSHIRKAHPNMKEGKRMDIMRKASYGTCDKAPSR